VLRAEHDFRIIRLPVLVTQKQKSRAAATNRIALAGGSFWGEAFADHSDPGASLEDAENLDSVYDFLIDMNERDRKILIGRMRGEKLHEIAARHGFSKERIRQIVRDNINEMRERLCPA
jgi:DNA-directed RNA polymerase sigma subunit (sigma70/sigma32)